jgi:predicted phosphoadenosine phosphosulfate sulfurtransferase
MKQNDQPRKNFDKRLMQLLDINVLDAAKNRIRDIMDKHDHVYIMYSGGKDSLVVKDLFEQVYEEDGIKDKIKVVFRDEEFIPDTVINFVDEARLSGKYDFRYYCLKLVGHLFFMGKKKNIIQWDERRNHIRPMPKHAITYDGVLDQYTTDEFITSGETGKKCMVLGIRSQESPIRKRAIVNKPNTPHITHADINGITKGRPIYDWLTEDVFKFFFDNGIRYNPIYDLQTFSRVELRVASYISVEACKRYSFLVQMYPVFFEQMCELFPELKVQLLYGKQVNNDDLMEGYERSWAGIFKYIDDKLDGHEHLQARERVLQCMKHRQKAIENGGAANFGGYPIFYVFQQITNGQFKRVILPKPNPSKKDFDYERNV